MLFYLNGFWLVCRWKDQNNFGDCGLAILNRLKRWTGHVFGPWGLPIIFLFESFLFFPLDLVLFASCHRNKEKAFSIAFLCALTSSLAAIVSYFIGRLAWETMGIRMLGALGGLDLVKKIAVYLEGNLFIVTFLGAILPIPTKIVTISCGFLKTNLKVFFIAIFIARIVRFSTIAYLAKRFGHKVEAVLKRFLPT
jgi:membrane protein YqaA with SNARE-associated domain